MQISSKLFHQNFILQNHQNHQNNLESIYIVGIIRINFYGVIKIVFF